MLPFYPQHMFCGVEDEEGGLAVVNIGLPEYAVHDDPVRTVGLTLLRTYRYPVIGANPEDTTTDGSQLMCQCLRPFCFDYAVYPYAGGWETGQVFRQAYRFNLPLRLSQTGRSGGTLPPSLAFVRLEPEQLVLSALKASSRSAGLIIRLFNPTERTIEGRLTLFRPVREATFVDLNEQPLGPAGHQGSSVFLTAAKGRIVTVEVFLDGA